jgi:hypothetical protein
MDPDKRLYRKLKRTVKRTGNKRRRQFLKRELAERPDDAPYSEFDFGRNSSQDMNGLDRDATRRREEDETR